MIESLLSKLEALVNERGSAAVLREHLALVRAQCQALEQKCTQIEAQLGKQQAAAQQLEAKHRRFAQDNPLGLRCDACGSVDLRRTGARPDPTFAALGIKQAQMTCRVCSAVSFYTEEPPR